MSFVHLHIVSALSKNIDCVYHDACKHKYLSSFGYCYCFHLQEVFVATK